MLDANKEFEKLDQKFFQEWIRRNPILGSSLGFHDDCDDRMPDGTLERELDDHRLFARWQAEFGRIDPKRLSPANAVNREFALALLRHWLFERAHLRLWERLPEAPIQVGWSLFQVLGRNYAPLRERMKALHRRLELLPKYVEETKERLKHPVKYFVENELETLTRLPGYFNTMRDISREHLGPAMERQMHKVIESSQNALEKYSDWLIVDVLPVCGERWAIDEGLYNGLLKARGIDLTARDLIRRGEEEMERILEKMREIGRSIKRKSTVADVRDLVKAQHPDGSDAALRFVRESLGKAKQFVNRSKFAAIHEHDSIYVIETPSFLRHLYPLSGYLPPAKYETKRDGYVFVSPGDCDSDKLKEHNYSSLVNLTTHQAYPGRHLLAGWSMQNPSWVRTFAQAHETLEGWAYYCEERVKEMGFDDTPNSRFMQLNNALFAAGRMVLDAKLATGQLTFTQGVEFLIDHIGTDRVASESEVRRLSVTPTLGATEFWGREQIKEIKKAARERMKARFSETFFHLAVLKSGGLPPRILQREIEWRVDEELAKPPPKEAGDKKGAKGKGADGAAARPAKGARPAAPAKVPVKAKAPVRPPSRPKPRAAAKR